jgi:hypothetical protein
MKKNEKDFEFVKNSENDKNNYIFQNDNITKIGTVIVAAFLVGLILAVIFTGVFF